MPSRRLFLTASAMAVSATLGKSSGLVASAQASFDKPSFDARLHAPYRHRQVFGAHKIDDGSVLEMMKNSLNAYQFEFGEGAGTMHVAAVLYGSAVPIALDDYTWRTYAVATASKRRGDEVSHAAAAYRNPFLQPTPHLGLSAAQRALGGIYQDQSIPALIGRGASLFVCDNALSGLATFLITQMQSTAQPIDIVLADLRRHLVPGAMIVPAGVAALNAAQEAKFTYVQASI